MEPVVALGVIAEKTGIAGAAALAAGALLLPDGRRRAIALLSAIVVTAAVLVGHIWNSDQFRSISDDAVLFSVSLGLLAAAVAALAAAFVRRPALFALLAVASLPFRVPIEAAGSTSNLLVPLYVVIAGGGVAYLWRCWTADRPAGTGGRPSILQLALAAFVVLYAVQSLYSRDFDAALEHLVFFYVPFALLFVLLAGLRWTRPLLAGCAGVLVVLALTFSAIGFWEYAQRELLWNPKVISANQFESYFRVNSVFWDPNIYGRFLALVMTVVAGIMLWSRAPRVVLASTAVLTVLWGGLVFTFSQSSFVALLVGLAVLAAFRWDPRRTAALSAVGAALVAIFLLAFQDSLNVDLGSSSGLNKATSGRIDLIEGGAELFADRPGWGYGSGSFPRAFRLERKGNQQQAVSASHTLPLTVAAEQGVIGLLAYALLLVAAFATLLGRAAPARGPPPGPDAADRTDPGGSIQELGTSPATQAVLTAALAALAAHTMMYAAFLEDPFTWVILALGLATAPHARLAGLDEEGRRRSPAARPATAPA
jgi:O-antigen ligase